MNETTNRCPNCAHAATGRFCNNCGASLAPAKCRTCGTDLSAGARFCHLCGAPQLGDRASAAEGAWLSRIGWGVAGVATVALFVVLAIRLPNAGPSGTTNPMAAAPVARPAPDISNMTPGERADSLFNRIMMEYEAGNRAQVDFFRPMALQAYALLGALDADARYHVGLIHAVTGNLPAARAQVDSIHDAYPNHLMGFMLQAATARLGGDQAALGDAYRGFVAAYDGEISLDRQAYTEHGQAIQAFAQEARLATGSGGS